MTDDLSTRGARLPVAGAAPAQSSFVDASGALLPEPLRHWRDAATSGGLPDATNPNRWQQLRAGLVNMWEFEVAEFWSADGRLQLMGHNETGKSTLMTLTTLIMLAGSTAPHFIDTMGGSNKRFRYYVEPTGLAGDRRDASKHTNRGWVWVEYGRLVDGMPQYFTTLLFADARRADQSKVRLTWATLAGPARVRRDVTLINGSAVTDPSQLTGVPGWRSFGSDGKAYQDHLARHLLTTTADRLDGYVRLLKVMRTPKLGERLNLAFLSEKIREALPPLSTHELTQLAEGWEELERIAADRDSAELARREADAFRRGTWQPWAGAHVRRAADGYTAATTEFDNVTRTAREAKRTLDEAEGQLAELNTRVAEAKAEHATAKSELLAHQRSDAFTNAQAALASAQYLYERAQARAEDADRAEAETQRLAERADEIAAEATRLGEMAESTRSDERRVAELVSEHVRAVGLGELAERWVDDGDVDRLDAARERRSGQVARLSEKLTFAKDRADEASAKTEAARQLADHVAQLDAERIGARSELDAEAQRLMDQLGVWVSRLPVPGPDGRLTDGWAKAVEDVTVADKPRALLAALITAQFLQPLRSELLTTKAAWEQQAKAHRSDAEELAKQVERWQREPEPRPVPPSGWLRRDRPDFPHPDGAPLWRLVDVAGGVPDEVRLRLQAALDAAGLLDAWVTPDGTFSATRDGYDQVAVTNERASASSGAAGGSSPRTLATLLTAAPDAGLLTRVVSTLLASIQVVDAATPMPGGVAVCPSDGRWATPVAAGRARPHPDAPVLLGAAARARFRAAEIERLTAEHDRAVELARKAGSEAEAVVATLAALTDAEASAPRDDVLVQHVLTVRRLDGEHARLDERRAVAEAAAQRARQAADDAAADASSFAAEHALPHLWSEADALARKLTELHVTLVQLRSARHATSSALEAAERATAAADLAACDAEGSRGHACYLRQEATALARQADVARRRLDQEGQEALREVERLEALVAGLEEELAGLGERHEELLERRAQARAHLDRQREATDDARWRRDAAEEAWWTLVDLGLTAALGVPEPAGRNTAAARDHVRDARRIVQPRHWPRDDAAAQQVRIDKAWGTLAERLTELRSTLERTGGRTARIVHDGDDPAGLPRIEVVVDGTGVGYTLGEAVAKLGAQHDELMRAYDSQMQRTLHELLGSAFIEHLRERLEAVEALERHVNRILDAHPTGTTGTKLRLVRVPADGDTAASRVLNALQRELGSLGADVQEQVRQFLRARIEEARRSGDAAWREQLAVELDYRRWFDVRVQKKSAGDQAWRPLDARSHGEMSGGAQVVTLMLPLVAALAAMYEETPNGPRPLWLDEAFDGVDARNRASVLDLLREFDMDFQLAGPGPLVNTATVPSAALYEVVRDTHLPGADLTLMLWAAGQLHVLDLMDPATVARHSARAAEGDDLLDAAGL